MGLLDALFGTQQTTPTVGSILPDAAKLEIMDGRLPRLNTDNIFLKKGEYCCYIDKAILLVEKTKRVYEHIGGSVPGIFSDKNRMSYGNSKPREYIETEQYRAILYITNQRIILQCKEQGFDKQHKYLSAIKPFSNAVELQYGSKTYELLVPDGELVYQTIKLIQQRRSIY